MHEHVDKRPMPGVLKHQFVFKIVENRLYERAFAQKNFLFERHQNIFHRAFYPRDYFQSSSHQTKKQILADVTFVRKQKSLHVCCHLRHHRPIVHVAFRKFRVHQISFVIDNYVQFKTEKPTFRRFPSLCESFENFVPVNSLRMAHVQGCRIDICNFASFPQSTAK